MAASLISNIYDELRSSYEDNPEFIIDFFTKNTIAFNNITVFSDIDDLRCYIELTCLFTEALYKKDRYDDTVDTINKLSPIINKEVTRLEAFELKGEWYHSILFLKGMASYSLRDYKTATPISES